jgi:hypothetical protein
VSESGNARHVTGATATWREDSGAKTMNAMIIYEESGIAAEANALLKRASDRADAATDWAVKPWRLDMLRLPATANEAQRDGAAAHLVVLAIGRRTELPEGLLDWLEAWARRRWIDNAALAVFEGGRGDRFSATASSQLSEFAQRQGLSLIVGEVDPGESQPARVWTDTDQRDARRTATMAYAVAPASPGYYQHWGINE